MTHVTTNGTSRSVRHRGASVLAVTVIIVAGFVGALGFAAPASAAPLGVSTPNNSLFTSTVTVSGTKEANSYVQVSPAGGGEPWCIDPASGSSTAGETWSCSFTPGDGSHDLVVSQFYDDTNTPNVAPVGLTVRVLGAPAITSPALSTGLVSGTGLGGAAISLTATGANGSYSGTCTTVQPGGFWSCPLSLPSGDYSVTAQQLWAGTGEAGGTSGTFALTVDKQAPSAPTIARPSAGDRITSQPFAYSGSGENDARVDVFVDAILACSATVSAGIWACSSAGVTPGDRIVQAIQWDAAGNSSASSTSVRVTFADPDAAAPPVTPGTPGTPATPGTPETPPGAPSTPTPSPAPTQSAAPTFPFFPPPVGGDSGLPPGDTWGTPTYYGAAIPRVGDALGTWWRAVLLALAFIALVALPLRLLVTVLRGRVTRRARQFAGRNRTVTTDDEPFFSPRVTAALSLAAAIALAALAGGVQGEVRYLRLIVAIGVALLVVNGVGVALATKLPSRALGGSAGIRLVPLLLGAAALSALLSRALGIQPPIIIGVVIAATFAVELGRQARGLVALVQLGVMSLLGLGAWLGHSAIGPVEGFGPSFASETLAALSVAALGSTMFLLLPVAGMPGQVLFEWSRPAWAGMALVGATLASAAVAGGAGFPATWFVGAAAVFAAVSVSTWAWIRYVEPQLLPAHSA